MKTSFTSSIKSLTFFSKNFSKQFTMKNLVRFSFVALIFALFLTSSAFGQSQKCFTFTNGESQNASDLHIELSKGSCTIKNIDAQGRVGGVFKGIAGGGSNKIDLYNGTVPVGGSVEVCFSYDGTDPDVRKWFWSKGMQNNDPKRPIMLGTVKTPQAGQTILTSVTPNTEGVITNPNGTTVVTVNTDIPYTNGENVVISNPTTTNNNPVNNNPNANCAVDCSKISYRLGTVATGGAICVGLPGSAPAGASITVSDGKGGTTTGTANANGSFHIGCGGLNATQGEPVTVTINGADRKSVV